MEKEQFAELVRKLEVTARQNPSAYKYKILGLVLLGYGYILFLLGLLVAALGGLVYFAFFHGGGLYLVIKVGFVLCCLIYMIVRSLWVQVGAPEGLVLSREQTPALFALIDDVAARLQSPAPDVVLLDDEFNASISQVPRLGIFGWYKGYLVLGLPLLQSVTPEEFKAILAHEFGHLSGNHGRFGGWIYRVRVAWTQLMESLHGKGGASLFSWFFNWYAPQFVAYSFVLARANEYVADRCAVEIGGSRTFADALLRIRVAGTHFHENFWPDFYKQANALAAPPPPFIGLRHAFAHFDAEPANRWLKRALNEPTGEVDTHPSLTDRLGAINETPRLPPEFSRTAAEEYLGDALIGLTTAMDMLWTANIEPAWKERHEEQQQAQEKFRELGEKAARGEEISLDEQLQLALWREEFENPEAAQRALEEFVTRFPDNAQGTFSLGRVLLERSSAGETVDHEAAARAIELLEQAMKLDPEATLPACQMVYTYLCENDRRAEAENYMKRAEKRGELEYEAAVERHQLDATDVFLPHGLGSEELQALQAGLATHSRVKEAYFVRKQLNHDGPPLYLLAILFEYKMLQVENEEQCKQWAAELAQSLPIPGECFVIALHGNFNAFKKPLEKQPDAKIYAK